MLGCGDERRVKTNWNGELELFSHGLNSRQRAARYLWLPIFSDVLGYEAIIECSAISFPVQRRGHHLPIPVYKFVLRILALYSSQVFLRVVSHASIADLIIEVLTGPTRFETWLNKCVYARGYTNWLIRPKQLARY